MDNQTSQNDQINRGKKMKKELEIALRSVWQGEEYENQTFNDEVNFELYELDFIYEANEEENKDV